MLAVKQETTRSISVVSVIGSTSSLHEESPGSMPRTALQEIKVAPIPMNVARELVVKNHYLHSIPGGTQLAFGIFQNERLLGALTIGCGPSQAYRLVNGAKPEDCGVLTRLWLSDELPKNSESRVIGIVLRALRKNTWFKFLLSYADPSQGHIGTIYQATGWLYTGLSEAMPLYDLGDGIARHSRSFSHAFGTHSLKHFRKKGINVKMVFQSAKHRYIYFLDRSWAKELKVPVLQYPKRCE